MTPEPIDRTSPNLTASRRSFLKGMTFLLPAAWLLKAGTGGAYAQVTATASAPPDFMEISKLLTGHPEIDDGLADLAWSALVRREEGFAQSYDQLSAAITGGALSRFEDLPQSAVMTDPALKGTAVALIYAWYLGRVGEVLERGEPGPDFISYTGALMWRPTIDATLIPTYAQGGPGHWATPPATLATD